MIMNLFSKGSLCIDFVNAISYTVIVMAIDYIDIQPMSRTNGANAVEAAAYRSNSKMYDEQIGQVFDYTNKKDCVYENIMLPETAFNQEFNTSNHTFNDREKLWNAVELKEDSHNRRDSARVAFEIKLALPKELSLEQNKKLLNEFVYDNYVSKFNIGADICIHDKGDGNVHAHVMLTTRAINGIELSNKKSRDILPKVLKSKGLAFSQKDGIANKWRAFQNGFFKHNGIDLVVDQNKIHTGIHMRRSRLDGGFLNEDINKNIDINQKNLDEVSKDHNIIIDTLSKRQSTFTKGDIECLVLKCTVSDKDKYQEVLDKVLASEKLIDLGLGAYGKQTYTSQENYRKDIQLIELSNDLAGRRNIAVKTRNIDTISDKFTLFDEQKNALKHISHRGDLSCVVGYAGAGKSHTLKAVNDLYSEQGYKVYGTSISGKVAQSLESDTNIKSRTIASLLESYNNQSNNLPEKGSVLVIDEAGMVGLDDMVDLMKMSKERDLKLVLVGDPNQLEAIGKGSPFKYILDDVGFVPMKGVVRQKDELDRKATVNLAEGKVGLAINHYNAKNNIHIKKDYEILDAVVGKYSEYVNQDKINDTLVLSYARKDVAQLNDSIRNMLVENKKLSLGNSININIPKGMDSQEAQSKRFAVGEKIVFLRNGKVDDEQLVKNGLFGNITSIDNNIMTIKTHEKENSRDIKVDISKYNNFDYGYATTVHKSQGATVDNTLLYVNSKGWNRNLAYVGMSRHKDNLDVFVNKDKYNSIDTLKRGLSSKSSKELNVAEFIERKHPANFFHKIGQELGISEKYQIKDTNHNGLGVSKDLYDDLVRYSKEYLSKADDKSSFEKRKIIMNQAQELKNKHADEINSILKAGKYNKNQRDLPVVPLSAQNIISKTATDKDIFRMSVAINEQSMSLDRQKLREKEQSLNRSGGIDL